MQCPNCGCELTDKIKCEKCGINIEIYMKSKGTSIKLYIKGLEQANNKNLSSAVELLNKSLNFDKKNHYARNVLGLVYFEIGEISKAIKEWIISDYFVKENNLAKDYLEIAQNKGKLEKYKNSISMFNQALVYLNQKSEDMAIIQLKKAIDLNHNFVEAYNLLALCYISTKNNDKALNCIEKVLEIDNSNPKALKYYNELKGSTPKPVKVEKPIKTSNNPSTTPKYSPNPIEKRIKINTIFGGITSFIVGAVSIAIFIYILIIPSIKEEGNIKITELADKNAVLEKKLDDVIEKNNEAIAKLSLDKENIENENKILNEQLYQKELTEKVQQVSSLYNNGNKEDATILLLSLEDFIPNFTEETKTLYSSLKGKILPDMARTYYNSAMSKYNSRNYDEAKILLEKSISMSSGESFSGDVIYFIGRIDEINNNKEGAKENYQKVIDNYPKASQLSNAKARLANLK